MDKFAPLFVDIDLPDAVILCDALSLCEFFAVNLNPV